MSGKAPGVGLMCELSEDGDLDEIMNLVAGMVSPSPQL